MKRVFTALVAALFFFGMLAAAITHVVYEASAACDEITGYGCDASVDANTDDADTVCTADDGDTCDDDGFGPDTPAKGEKAPMRYLWTDQTGVSSRPVKYTKDVPEGAYLIIEGVKVHVAGTKVHGNKGVFAALKGGRSYTWWVTDGASGITHESYALTEFCGRWDNNLGNARGKRFTPKAWGDNPCNVQESAAQVGPNSDATPDNSIDDCGNTNDCANAIDGVTSNVVDDGGTNNNVLIVTEGNSIDDSGSGDPTTVDGKTRCDTTCGGDPQDFAAGDAVVGSAIDLNDDGVNDCQGGNCYYSSAPNGGKVYGGVVHPWKDEVKNLKDLS